MDIKKINEYLRKYENEPKVFEQDYFKLAICYAQLSNYRKAKELFSDSLTAMFGSNPYWRASSQPNWLVDVAVLSGRSDLYPSVLEELTLYRLSSTKSNPIGNSPIAHYCYSVMEILYPGSGNISDWIKGLVKRPKYKDMYAIGLVIQAITSKNQILFTNSLQLLLKAHEGQAKYGELRLTPEGWVCLPAMTLSYLANQRNLKLEVENEYLPLGYLSYLREQQII